MPWLPGLFLQLAFKIGFQGSKDLSGTRKHQGITSLPQEVYLRAALVKIHLLGMSTLFGDVWSRVHNGQRRRMIGASQGAEPPVARFFSRPRGLEDFAGEPEERQVKPIGRVIWDHLGVYSIRENFQFDQSTQPGPRGLGI